MQDCARDKEKSILSERLPSFYREGFAKTVSEKLFYFLLASMPTIQMVPTGLPTEDSSRFFPGTLLHSPDELRSSGI